MSDQVFVGLGGREQALLLPYANRHGLIAGATGTGKTVTLQVLAEGLSAAGVPVFCADIKGDLSGLAMAGEDRPRLRERAARIGLSGYAPAATPAVFWDVFGAAGHPVRATVSEMGPLLLARMMDLNDVQEGVLTIAFRVADEEGLPILDLKDLRAVLAFLADNAEAFRRLYGNVSPASVGAIQRALLVLETQGADHFFGEPALDLSDLMRMDAQGRGIVSVLDATRLIKAPRLYATFLLWLLSELFETLPEAGDLPKPRLVFFFDEAHLLFDDAPPALLDKVTQVVRLIRSKGVGIFFVTQHPQDVPDMVGSQLGNRIQHALRAFTPKEQRAVRVAAETFRPNPAFAAETVITELGVGEALTSFLEEKAVPGIVERTLIRPPAGRIGPVTPQERAELRAASPIGRRYDVTLDRDSAHEMLARREAAEAARTGDPLGDAYAQGAGRGRDRTSASPPTDGGILDQIFGTAGRRESAGEAFAKSVARSIGGEIGRALSRGLFGTRRRRR